MPSKRRRAINTFRGENRGTQPGEAPGTLIHDPDATHSSLRFFGFVPEGALQEFEERIVDNMDSLPALMKRWPSCWIHVTGLENLEMIRHLGDVFHLHRLALEDVVNTHQRPKLEQYENSLFLVTRLNSWQDGLVSEQVSLFVGEGFVLSFQESESDAFNGVIDRLRGGKGRMRHGSDYLAYALLDSLVDHNFPILERYADRLEKLEQQVIDSPEEDLVTKIYQIKRDLAAMRRTVWPLRDVLGTLLRDETEPFGKETLLFLRDCYDHVLQLMDLIEHYRDVGSELVNVYMSGASNRMNEVMRLLTLIATIFIPLSFIAGLYGMNFNTQASAYNMPELNWPWGYPFALGLMALVVLSMLGVFWRKGWLGRRSSKGKKE